MFFTLFFLFVILERLVELWIAKKNERWLKRMGAKEFGSEHYKYIVLLHVLFLLSFYWEATWRGREASPYWAVILFCFVLTQLLRIWTILSLGRFWNTKIIVLPHANVIAKGPYRLLRHPNYVIVVLEIMLIPALFQAYWTAVVFTFLNFLILSVRIPAEEKALSTLTDYEQMFRHRRRFMPVRPVK